MTDSVRARGHDDLVRAGISFSIDSCAQTPVQTDQSASTTIVTGGGLDECELGTPGSELVPRYGGAFTGRVESETPGSELVIARRLADREYQRPEHTRFRVSYAVWTDGVLENTETAAFDSYRRRVTDSPVTGVESEHKREIWEWIRWCERKPGHTHLIPS